MYRSRTVVVAADKAMYRSRTGVVAADKAMYRSRTVVVADYLSSCMAHPVSMCKFERSLRIAGVKGKKGVVGENALEGDNGEEGTHGKNGANGYYTLSFSHVLVNLLYYSFF